MIKTILLKKIIDATATNFFIIDVVSAIYFHFQNLFVKYFLKYILK